MPRLDYTNDLRRKAGQTNDASELIDNLADVQTWGRAFDHVNVDPWSLDFDHVYDGGGAPPAEPLRDVQFGTVASVAVAVSGAAQQIIQLTVPCVSGIMGIFLYAHCGIDASLTLPTDAFTMYFTIDGGASVRQARHGAGTIVGEGLTHAFLATAGSHTVEFMINVTSAALPNLVRAHFVAFAVNR